MTLLWTKSKLPTGVAITWVMDEPCSHFAIQFFDSFVIHSNFTGVHVLPIKDFLKTSRVIYAHKKELEFDVEAALFIKIMQAYWGKKYDWKWFFWLAFYGLRRKLLKSEIPDKVKWQSRAKFLCTEVVEFLEPVLGYVDIGNGSPYRLAKHLGVV